MLLEGYLFDELKGLIIDLLNKSRKQFIKARMFHTPLGEDDTKNSLSWYSFEFLSYRELRTKCQLQLVLYFPILISFDLVLFVESFDYGLFDGHIYKKARVPNSPACTVRPSSILCILYH